jgi:WD40 repeat protein
LAAPADDLDAEIADYSSTAVLWAARTPVAALVDLRAGDVVPLDPEPRDGESVEMRALPSGAAQLHADGTVRLFDRTGRPGQLLTGHTDPVTEVAVSPDGRWAATAGEGGAVVVWDVDAASGRWQRRESLVGHAGDVVAAEIDPTGTQLFTASVDDTVITWDMRPDRVFGRGVPPLDGRYVANRPQPVGSGDLMVAATRSAGALSGDRLLPGEDTLGVAATFVDADTGRVVEEVDVGRTFQGPRFGSSVSVSPDGRTVIVTWGLGATVLDVRTREELAVYRLPPLGRDVNDDGSVLPAEVVWCAAWTPDGSRLLLGVEGRLREAADGGFVVIDTATWEEVARVDVGTPQTVEATPDGRFLAVAREDAPEILVLDAEALEVQRTVPFPEETDFVYDLSFSDDGRLLAAGGEFGRLFVLDTDSWTWHGRPANLHDNSILQVEWLPDDRTVASAGADGRVILFDTERGQQRAVPLPASTQPGEGFAHLAPGIDEELTVLSGERPGRRYPIDPVEWQARACAVVGRDLTEAEWDRYLPGRPYRPTCSDL